ncbi:hypothetical protein F5Y03DRAFT_398843 [Xylaria venustula]|nr:hypothetical protein F5Y03DRAFT_398843 [Xylaria venustula]
MAIHDDVPGIEVTVRCDKLPLPEFDDPNAHVDDDDDASPCPSTTKYIECVDDAEFDISIAVDSDYHWGYRDHILVAKTYIDGESVRGDVINSKHTKFGLPEVRIVKGKEVQHYGSGIWSIRRCKFAAVKTIDDARKERVQSDLKIAKDLGTIEVRFTRALDAGISVTSYGGATNIKGDAFELAEKSLKGKAVSHGASYGICEAIPTPKWVCTRELEEDNGPIVIFKFIYRSREALKRELIIPRSPPRSPTLEDLTPAERDRLARERLNELRGNKIKSENGSSLIKREFGEVFDLTQGPPLPRPLKKSRLQDGREVDVVDLTDD